MKTYGVIMAGGGGTRFWPALQSRGTKAVIEFEWKRPDGQ